MKCMIGLASLLATALLTMVPVAAQAAPTPHWFSDGKLIVGQSVVVKTAGVLTFNLTQFGVKVRCKVIDSDTITNPASGGPGTDEMTAFRLTGCKESGTTKICKKKMEVIAHGLPWLTHLTEAPPAPGVRDVIEGVALEFRCAKGPVLGTATGLLKPKVGNSVLEFEAESLGSPFGAVLVEGLDSLKGPKGDTKITAA